MKLIFHVLQILIFITVFDSKQIYAGITEGKVNYKVEKNQITLITDKGFHFNEKAPMLFKMYVCDDANTTCEAHEIKPQTTDKEKSKEKNKDKK